MKFLFCFVFIFFIVIHSQDIPSTSTGKLKFYVDYSAFKGKESKTYQEFYLMIHADQLGFTGNDKNTSFKVSSLIRNREEKLISKKVWTTDALLRDSLDLRTLVLYDKWAELLIPGEYKVSVNVIETENNQSGTAEFNLNVPSFGDTVLSASSIEFISKIEGKGRNNHFEKNGRIMIPNPWRRYGLLIPNLSFHYEIYNIKNPAYEKFLLINYTILNKDKEEVKKLSGVQVKKSAENVSVVHAMDLKGLSSGIYELYAEIRDSAANQKYILSRRFEIIQTDFFSINVLLTEEETELAGKLLEYFATPGEYDFFRTLTLHGKTKYLLDFWREKDSTPETRENEFLERVMERFHYANQHFSWGKTEGYKTDKGRILIKYGVPDEIQSYSSESDASPYEIWTYTEDKKFIFVFGDINSTGNFVLLHSTKEGEVSNYNWKDYIRSF